MTIEAYITRFENLRRNKSGGRERPHKICMLLAVLDLAKAGGLEKNKIYLNPELVERYTGFFKVASMTGEWPNPHYPYFFLRGKLAENEPSFWHLHPIPGRESLIDSLHVQKASDVSNNIEYASLDSELFDLLQDLENIERLEESLTRYWFDRGHADLRSVVKASGGDTDLEVLEAGRAVRAADHHPIDHVQAIAGLVRYMTRANRRWSAKANTKLSR